MKEAGGRRQEAGGRKQPIQLTTDNLLNFAFDIAYY
jgi:hypothetical protein